MHGNSTHTARWCSARTLRHMDCFFVAGKRTPIQLNAVILGHGARIAACMQPKPGMTRRSKKVAQTYSLASQHAHHIAAFPPSQPHSAVLMWAPIHWARLHVCRFLNGTMHTTQCLRSSVHKTQGTWNRRQHSFFTRTAFRQHASALCRGRSSPRDRLQPQRATRRGHT